MKDIPKETILQAAEGDLDAFEDIYRVTSGFVYNTALRVVANKEDAEEVTQDVFIKVHRNLKNFHFRSSLKTWIYRITVNTAINKYKKRKREMTRTVEYDDRIEVEGASENAEKELYRKDNEKLIGSLLRMLNPQQRACIVLRSIEGLSYKEIADSLGTNINTVRTRLKRAREKILSIYGRKVT
ncbi:MAG: sigma-70 family RNA polymerase sigma factor [Candidatus Omnitrophota bacterium]